MTSNAGSWIAVFIGTGDSKYHIKAGHWTELLDAYRAWIEQGKDEVLEFTCLDGDPCVFAASKIADFAISTPECREAEREWRRTLKEEVGPDL